MERDEFFKNSYKAEIKPYNTLQYGIPRPQEQIQSWEKHYALHLASFKFSLKDQVEGLSDEQVEQIFNTSYILPNIVEAYFKYVEKTLRKNSWRYNVCRASVPPEYDPKEYFYSVIKNKPGHAFAVPEWDWEENLSAEEIARNRYKGIRTSVRRQLYSIKLEEAPYKQLEYVELSDNLFSDRVFLSQFLDGQYVFK